MFKLEKADTFVWPVMISIPRSGGTFTKASIDVEFKLLEQSKLDAALERLKDDDVDLLKELVVGWTAAQMQDAAGNPIPFSEEARDKFIDLPYARTGLLKAYFEAANGNKVRAKN